MSGIIVLARIAFSIIAFTLAVYIVALIIHMVGKGKK